MYRNLLKAVIAAVLLGCASLATAQERIFHPYYFGATVGYDFLDSGRRADDEILYGLNIGWFIAPKFSIDLEWDKVESEIDPSIVNSFISGATYNDLFLESWTLMGRYYFGDPKTANWNPYVAGGFGFVEHSSIFGTNWDPALNIGVGMMGNHTPNFSTRWQVLYRRDGDDDTFSGQALGVPNVDGYNDVIASVNAIYRFGGKAAPAPVAETVRDSDGDGVPDDRDRCPNTPAGVEVDQYGCPLDSDGDGVPDYRDKCPGTPAGAIVDRDGCEIPPVVEIPNVYFEFDSAKLKPESINTLDQAVEMLTVNEQVYIEIAGHTDSIGTEAYNQDLSERRAKSVMDYFVDQGINATRLTSKGYGESRPIASNDTREGRAQNRRVEMIRIER